MFGLSTIPAACCLLLIPHEWGFSLFPIFISLSSMFAKRSLHSQWLRYQVKSANDGIKERGNQWRQGETEGEGTAEVHNEMNLWEGGNHGHHCWQLVRSRERCLMEAGAKMQLSWCTEGFLQTVLPSSPVRVHSPELKATAAPPVICCTNRPFMPASFWNIMDVILERKRYFVQV